MKYSFKCPKCGFVCEVDIPMAEYNNLKDKQLCPVCLALDSNQVLLKRVIEWSGIATGAGEGWFGKSTDERTIHHSSSRS